VNQQFASLSVNSETDLSLSDPLEMNFRVCEEMRKRPIEWHPKTHDYKFQESDAGGRYGARLQLQRQTCQ
jgi:hypothetical protein